MILKDNYRSKVESVDGLIIKTLKPGHEFHTREGWMDRINEFSLLYGHAPQVIEYTTNRLVTTEVTGESAYTLVQQRNLDYSSLADLFKKIQFLYMEFITHLLEYNLNFEYPLIHLDLNLGNLFVQDDLMVCIDIDSMIISDSPCEFNWILKPFCDMIWQADVINRAKEQKYYKAKMQLYKSEIERLNGTKFWEM